MQTLARECLGSAAHEDVDAMTVEKLCVPYRFRMNNHKWCVTTKHILQYTCSDALTIYSTWNLESPSGSRTSLVCATSFI